MLPWGAFRLIPSAPARDPPGRNSITATYHPQKRKSGAEIVKINPRHEMLDIVVIDGKARGIIARNLVTGELERHFGHAVLLGSGGYGKVFFLSTNSLGSKVPPPWEAHKKRAFFRHPPLYPEHPPCLPPPGGHHSQL